MAAHADSSIKNLNGRWSMDKVKSDDTDAILALQGVSWFTRKAIGLATVTLSITQYEDDAGDTHVDIAQTITGGIPGTTELRTLNWGEREHTDHVFGAVKGRSRYIQGTECNGKVRPDVDTTINAGDQQEAVLKFLKGEILADGSAVDGFVVSEGQNFWIQSLAESKDNGWTAEQIWGFEMIDGLKRYTRRVVVVKGKTVIKARLVYDYLGQVE